jgi:hypothetical protein
MYWFLAQAIVKLDKTVRSPEAQVKPLASGRPEGWFIGGVHPVEDWVEDLNAIIYVPRVSSKTALWQADLALAEWGLTGRTLWMGRARKKNKNSVSSMNCNTNG